MNKLERIFLSSIKFNVAVQASTYAKYYFHLRDVSKKGENFSLLPLTQEMEQQLEIRSSGAQEKHETRRQSDVKGFKEKSPPYILN